jgi:hypothetical protein
VYRIDNNKEKILKSLIYIVLVFMFAGCVGGEEGHVADRNGNANDGSNSQTVKNRVVTVYVDGYDKDGESSAGVAGDDVHSSTTEKIMSMSGFASTDNYKDTNVANIIATTDYYGEAIPDYYTQKDRDELQNSEAGIPKYALVIAKFAKHIMQKTGSSKINFVSASMGSLITRYVIEKDLEGLASSKVIAKWLSFEGVVAGNIAADHETLVGILNFIVKQPAEVDQMKYSWMKKTFGSLYGSNSPFMQNIEIAFESSTNDDLNDRAVSLITKEPNDGVQAVRDTYFHTDDQSYMHSYFHQTHTSLEDSNAPWAFAATFLTSKKRVKVTLLKASLSNLYEDAVIGDVLPAEIVFESRVYSEKAKQKWSFDAPIDERVYRGHTLKIFEYQKTNEDKAVNNVVFNSKVLETEDKLKVEIRPIEIDWDMMYGVQEVTGHGQEKGLQKAEVTVPLENGEYPIECGEWSGLLKVEVYTE